MSLASGMRRWWGSARSGRAAGNRFAVACACGRETAGKRSLRHQVCRCPGCGQRVFVLPASPWTRPAPSRTAWWAVPLAVAIVTLGAVSAGFLLLLPRLGRPLVMPGGSPRPDFRAAAESGRRALADGNFFLAAREFASARGASRERATAAEQRGFEQLRRQAELLSLLHGRSLQEVLHEAVPLRSTDEWAERFRAEHLGRAVVFDDVVGRDAAGRPALTVYRVRAAGENARVALEDLRLLRGLPLEPPQRLLFGGRLAGLEREDGGGWAFRFEPDSGVFLTDAGAAAACLGPPDPDLLELLRRQERWVGSSGTPAETP